MTFSNSFIHSSKAINLREDVVLKIHACEAFESSQKFIARLVEEWDSGLDIEVFESLFISTIVKYARPFLKEHTGTKKQTFPLKELKRNSTFNQNIHEELIFLRNKILAHKDGSEFQTRFEIQEAPNGVVVCVVAYTCGILFINSRGRLRQILSHINTCREFAKSELDKSLGRLHEATINQTDMNKYNLFNLQNISQNIPTIPIYDMFSFTAHKTMTPKLFFGKNEYALYKREVKSEVRSTRGRQEELKLHHRTITLDENTSNEELNKMWENIQKNKM